MKNFIVLMLMLSAFSTLGQTSGTEEFGVSSETVPSGLQVGEKAPEIKAKTAEGKTFALYDQLKSKPVVLIFYRGYWCPVCSRYLSAYQDSLQLIVDRGASFIAVTPETYDFVEKTREKTKAGFEIISDTDGKIMEDYKVNFNVTEDYVHGIETHLNADIAKTNGQDEAVLPVPATYIIDQKGNIVYRQFDLNYSNRASVGEILKNLP
jgi:peroxiredoxin